MKSFYQLTLSLICILALVACKATDIHDANQRLTNYYLTKVAAERQREHERNLGRTEPQHSFTLFQAAIEGLNQLAAFAVGQAKSVSSIENKIAYYRIAATAAWQAENSNVLIYGQAGQQLCEKAKKNAKYPPRDCGMLVVIPALAGVDEQTNKFNKLRQRFESNLPKEPNLADKEQARVIFDNYSKLFMQLVEQRKNLATAQMSAVFMKGLDSNLSTLLCDHIDDNARYFLKDMKVDRKSDKQQVDSMKCEYLKSNAQLSLAACINKKKLQCQ